MVNFFNQLYLIWHNDAHHEVLPIYVSICPKTIASTILNLTRISKQKQFKSGTHITHILSFSVCILLFLIKNYTK